MSDRGWLGFGGRTRTPQPAQQPVTPETQSEAGDNPPPAMLRSQTQVHVQPQQHQHHHKPARLSRISSYIGLGAAAKSHSPTTPTYPEFSMERSESMKSSTLNSDSNSFRKKNENDIFYNEADATWHNPSLKQMVETVSCEMMRNGSSAPIPRHLNGWISCITEEVSHQFCELRDLRTQYDVLKDTRQKELKEFGAMTREWEQREYGFKAEINRLEHIISDTQQGAESIILVRAGSVVNRNDGRAFRAKLDRLSKSEDEDLTLDRNHDYLAEHDKRNYIALSTGDVGLSMDTSPYKTLGTVPRFIDQDSDVGRSQQFRSTTPKRRSKPEQDLGAKMAAARISVALTGKPPAPSVKGESSARNSDSSSSSSSSDKASSSSSLITQGLLAERLEQGQITPHTSPVKDEKLHGRPLQGPAKGTDILETIRELAAQNGGLPDDAVDEESSYASTIHLSQQRRPLSFVVGDEKSCGTDRPNKAQQSQRLQQSTAEGRRSNSQLDGLAQERGNVEPTTVNHRPSDSRDISSDEDSNNSRSSKLHAMNHGRVKQASEDEITTGECRDLDEPSGLVPMTKVMVLQRDAIANNLRPVPTKQVQERRVPLTSQISTDEGTQRYRLMDISHNNGRARLGDEELALTTPNRPSYGLAHYQAQGHMHGPTAPSAFKRLPSDVGCNQDATVAAAMALKRSTPEQKSQPRPQAQDA